MTSFLRRLVSTNKIRWTQDGYDLDLSYITDRILAMGYPSSGLMSLYRNPLDEAVRFLQERHKGHYKVYNLCIEMQYSAQLMGGPVVQFPMYDGQAPPLHVMHAFCLDAYEWMQADPANVVVVHCKAGKGRTGSLICALLLMLRKRAPSMGIVMTDEDPVIAVLRWYAEKRTSNASGITIASQRRYVYYYYMLLATATEAYITRPAVMQQIRIAGLPPGDYTLCAWVRSPEMVECVPLGHGHVSERSAVPAGRSFAQQSSFRSAFSSPKPSTSDDPSNGSRGASGAPVASAAIDSINGRMTVTLDFPNPATALVEGDIKVQLFSGGRPSAASTSSDGHLPPAPYSANLFKDSKSLLLAWLNMAYLPNTGGRVLLLADELDKVNKGLLKSSGSDLSLELSYQVVTALTEEGRATSVRMGSRDGSVTGRPCLSRNPSVKGTRFESRMETASLDYSRTFDRVSTPMYNSGTSTATHGSPQLKRMSAPASATKAAQQAGEGGRRPVYRPIGGTSLQSGSPRAGRPCEWDAISSTPHEMTLGQHPAHPGPLTSSTAASAGQSYVASAGQQPEYETSASAAVAGHSAPLSGHPGGVPPLPHPSSSIYSSSPTNNGSNGGGAGVVLTVSRLVEFPALPLSPATVNDEGAPVFSAAVNMQQFTAADKAAGPHHLSPTEREAMSRHSHSHSNEKTSRQPSLTLDTVHEEVHERDASRLTPVPSANNLLT